MARERTDDPRVTEAMGILRGLKPLRKRLGSLRAEPSLDAVADLAPQAGWQSREDAALRVMRAGEAASLQALPESSTVAALVDAPRGIPAPSGWHVIARFPMRKATTLNEWAARFARRLGVPEALRRAVAAPLDRLGIRDNVGARPCLFTDPSKELAVLARGRFDAGPMRRPPGDALRDLAMSYGGVGHLPVIGPNLASLDTVLLAGVVHLFAGATAMRVTVAVLAVLATVACYCWERWASGHYLAEDAREVVLDEVAGMSLALLFLPPDAGWPSFAAALVCFRIFDIGKWGVHWVERTGWRGSVVWDDLLAGLYAGLALAALHLLA